MVGIADEGDAGTFSLPSSVLFVLSAAPVSRRPPFQSPRNFFSNSDAGGLRF